MVGGWDEMESAEAKLDEAKLEKLGSAVRAALAADADAVKSIRTAREGLLQLVAARNINRFVWPRWAATRRGWRGWRGWIVLLAAGAAAGAATFWLQAQPPISFEVGPTASPGRLGDLVESSTKEPLAVRFSEGSSLLLHENSQVRVLSSSAKGARVLIESGIINVEISHARKNKPSWNFEAGPFHVLVTGTKFQLDFRPRDQSFSLVTQEGRVIVSGACLIPARAVSAGERLDVACPLKEGPVARTTANVSPGLVPASPADSAPTAEIGRAAHSTPPWRQMLAAGRLAEGLRMAERADFVRVCHVATAKELLALADAARLFGRSSRATTALRVLRQRFPASPDAATAAFTLGRIAFERQHAYAEAVDWFGTYLREQPNGALMGDSFGRLMEARSRSGDEPGARADAQQYLRRFPEGPYASEARGILSK
jgi:TolA-binding protein